MLFRSPNRFTDSVGHAESHDIKILTKFPGNLILEILIKFCNCVGGPNLRRCFLMKVCQIAIHNCPVILVCFLGGVYLILSEPTQF